MGACVFSPWQVFPSLSTDPQAQGCPHSQLCDCSPHLEADKGHMVEGIPRSQGWVGMRGWRWVEPGTPHPRQGSPWGGHQGRSTPPISSSPAAASPPPTLHPRPSRREQSRIPGPEGSTKTTSRADGGANSSHSFQCLAEPSREEMPRNQVVHDILLCPHPTRCQESTPASSQAKGLFSMAPSMQAGRPRTEVKLPLEQLPAPSSRGSSCLTPCTAWGPRRGMRWTTHARGGTRRALGHGP